MEVSETRIISDEQARKRRMAWDYLEAVVRAQHAEPVEPEPLKLGQAVAWISRDNGKANTVSAIHHYHDKGRTFCNLDIPPAKQHLPILPSLDECKRCAAMSRRAVAYAKLSTVGQTPMKASA